jgi:type II secretion system protein H
MTLAHHISTVRRRRFTLVELILVMLLMLVMAAMVTPSLGRFGKHRTVLEEARRLVAASRWANSEAGARGIYMELALDAQAGSFSVQPATGWPTRNCRPMQRQFDQNVLMLLPDQAAQAQAQTQTLIFHPDGTVAGKIPETVTLQDRFNADEQVTLVWKTEKSSYVFAEAKKIK